MAESSESSRKRARKSKLVPRECVEFDEENNTSVQEPELAVQALLPKLRTGLDRDDENYENSAPPPMEFSINVEVEECEEHFSVYDAAETFNDKDLKQCVIQDSVLRSEIKELWKTTTSLADKQLEIEIRNHWGKILMPVIETPFDYMLQQAINSWRGWNSQSKYRESFLLYKCYQCDIGWWHLMPFQEHIKQHEGIKVNIEICHHECNLVAYLKDEDNVMRDISIEGDCWRCLKTFYEHMVLKRKSNMYYFCEGCTCNFFTCSALFEHEGLCQKYHKLTLKDEVRHETDWKCNICQLNCLTKARYEGHLIGRHSVRSDFVVSTTLPKFCTTCDGKYMVYNLHICPRRPDNYQCKYCCRRFQSRHFASLHEKMTKSDYNCVICDKNLKKQCMKMEHMIKHSRNYMLAYKCALCLETILFPNENSLRRHRVIAHGMKFDKRRGYLDVLVVPKKSMKCTDLELDHVTIANDVNQPPDAAVAENEETNVNTEEHIITEVKTEAVEEIEVEETSQVIQEIDDAIDIKNEIEEAENAITNLLQESLNKKQENIDATEAFENVKVKTELPEIKEEKEDYEEFDEQTVQIYNSYEDIDVDIKKEQEEYIETLSKVFQASKSVSNRKKSNTLLLQKELMNKGKNLTPENVDTKESTNTHNESLKKLIAFRKYKGRKRKPDTTLLQKELLMAEKAFQDSNETTAEELDTYLLQEKSSLKENNTQVVNHITGEEISATSLLQGHQARNNVFQASKNITGRELPDIETFIHEEVVIKEELMDEDEYEDDIIVLNGNFDTSMNSENNDMKDEPRSSDVTSENSIPDIDNMTTLEPDVRIKVMRKKIKSYKCNKCAFEGPHSQFKEHKLFVCPRKKFDRPKTYLKKPDKKLWSKYPCSKCGETYNCLTTYAEHFAATHNLPKGGCPQCCIIRMETATLATHIVSHIKLSFVRMHMIKESSCVTSKADGVYNCKECSGTVRFKEFFDHWEAHMKLRGTSEEHDHSSEREDLTDGTESKLTPEKLKKLIGQLTSPWEKSNADKKNCVLCRRAFGRRNDVKRHLVEHLVVDAWAHKWRHGALRCQLCAAKYQAADRYKQHMRQHGSMPLYKCELCNRAFSDSSNFAKHKKVHNLRVLVCDICQKKYNSKHQLERHMEMHRVTEPIPCTACDKLFYSQSSYKKHYRNAHEKHIKRFVCVICRMRFKCLREKWDHMWNVHKERKFKADCPFCDVSFRKFQDVKSHVRDEHNVRLARSKDDEHVILFKYEG